MPLDAERVLCSTITLRHLPLADALRVIADLGFTGIDLGALPGVCDHVPFDLTDAAVAEVAGVVGASGLRVRSVNADVGDLNEPLSPAARDRRIEHVSHLLDLCTAIGADALVLPNGRQDHDPIRTLEDDLDLVASELDRIEREASARGVELWVEAPHLFRLVHDVGRAGDLISRLSPRIGVVCDTSHVVASGSTPREFLARFGERTRHVHLRDASPGYIHHSLGRGDVDFADALAALADHGYSGALALELETRDVENDERPAAALAAGEFISDLLATTRPTSEGAIA